MDKDLTEIIVVIDRSGSMSHLASDYSGGFNQFIDDQKKLPGKCLVTLAQFDDQYEIVHNGLDINSVSTYTLRPRGSTALLDAIGRTINEVGSRLAKTNESERPSKIIFMTITDGYENASREFNSKQINEMINTQKNVYKWDFMFIGANQDAIAGAKSFGMGAGITNQANPVGVRQSFALFNDTSTAYRSGATISASAAVGTFAGNYTSLVASEVLSGKESTDPEEDARLKREAKAKRDLTDPKI